MAMFVGYVIHVGVRADCDEDRQRHSLEAIKNVQRVDLVEEAGRKYWQVAYLIDDKMIPQILNLCDEAIRWALINR